MLNRREFVHSGLSAAALGLLARHGLADDFLTPALTPTGDPVLAGSNPFLQLPPAPPSVVIDGVPFHASFTGDDFLDGNIPFHTCENCFPGQSPPAPTEETDIAIVGGGLSGLATAYLLRRYRPVVFEMRPRFGGVAQGEIWNHTNYSLGTAYLIAPDKGSFLEGLYRDLRLDQAYRLSEGDDPVELGGRILRDFWSGSASPREEAVGYQRYAEVVATMAEKNYPDLPLPKGRDNQWILDLDVKTFKQDLEEQMGVPVPPLLAAAIQGYFYSSFNAGWEEISAASGWNFVAAEEYGRWIFSGGIAFLVDALWRKLARYETVSADGSGIRRLRAGWRVVDVRPVVGGRVQVSYKDPAGRFRSLLAKRVVMCCEKFLCKHILHNLAQIDASKLEAIERVDYRAYVVVNVLLNAPVALDFYDLFLLGDGVYPTSKGKAQERSRIIDVVSGHYARPQAIPRSVLTLYWPLPFASGRFTLITNTAWQDYAASCVPQIQAILKLLGLTLADVQQVRITRWGHAMPLARPNLIANGTVDHLRRPFERNIFFVNQDNWALPAVENCLLEAQHFEPAIVEGL